MRIWCALTDGDRLGCQLVRQPMACSPASVKQRCGLLLLAQTPVYRENKQKLFIYKIIRKLPHDLYIVNLVLSTYKSTLKYRRSQQTIWVKNVYYIGYPKFIFNIFINL